VWARLEWDIISWPWVVPATWTSAHPAAMFVRCIASKLVEAASLFLCHHLERDTKLQLCPWVIWVNVH
jgi:hypothetical protein